MQHNRVFRLTEDDIDELRDHTRDEALIVAYEQWVHRHHRLDALIHQIEIAFRGHNLLDGIGLLEANGIDDYATEEELTELRSGDETHDWRRLDTETLNRCYAAPAFLDARGFVFHLPAFLIAELNDKFDYGFIDRLIDADCAPPGWIKLLTPVQRAAIAATLNLVADHPDYCDSSDDIADAIKRVRSED